MYVWKNKPYISIIDKSRNGVYGVFFENSKNIINLNVGETGVAFFMSYYSYIIFKVFANIVNMLAIFSYVLLNFLSLSYTTILFNDKNSEIHYRA